MAYSKFYDNFYAWRQEVRAAFLAIWRFRPSRFYGLGFLFLQLTAWLQTYFIYRDLSGDLLVLHYNVDFGIDLVDNPISIFTYPFFGLIIFFLNLVIVAALRKHRDFHVYLHLLLSAALIFGAFLNLVLFFVYLINFR